MPRSQKHKKPDNLTVFFALSESVHVKAARKTLMKLTPGGRLTKQDFNDSSTQPSWTIDGTLPMKDDKDILW